MTYHVVFTHSIEKNQLIQNDCQVTQKEHFFQHEGKASQACSTVRRNNIALDLTNRRCQTTTKTKDTRTPKGMLFGGEVFCYIKPTKKHGTFGCLGTYCSIENRASHEKSTLQQPASRRCQRCMQPMSKLLGFGSLFLFVEVFCLLFSSQTRMTNKQATASDLVWVFVCKQCSLAAFLWDLGSLCLGSKSRSFKRSCPAKSVWGFNTLGMGAPVFLHVFKEGKITLHA